MKSFLYVLGDNPYENCHADYHTEGNGEWFTDAPNVEEALKIILSSMPFPGEPVGRKFFLETISLPGVADREVIQVWSTEPEVVKRTRQLLKGYNEGGLHDGNGKDFGLHMEIKVTDIGKYVAPARTLLAAPQSADGANTSTAISPMGASLIKFDDLKHEMQAAIQREQMDVARKQWEIESLEEAAEEKMKRMRQQLDVLNTYLHGTRHRTQLTRGKLGTGKYTVFQNRQFLSEEIALLGNFEDMDFKDMGKLEKWLVESGKIWKFLPFERCILATRIRQERKYYGNDPLTNFYNNLANMQNMIWIRDGENVFHVDVEFDFNNAVFPDKDQFDRAVRVCQNHLFEKCFEQGEPTNWHGEKLKKGEYDIMGKMRRKPLEEEEPYYTRKIVKDRFETMKEWLDSDCYTELLDKQLKEAVHDYLTEVNKRQMVFAVLLQGIVDNTQLLDIPKGTDLFNWESIDRYFDLLFDYTHALPWKGVSNKIAPFIDGKVSKGDWIVSQVEEHVSEDDTDDSRPRRRRRSTTYKESRPILFEVVDTEEVELERMSKKIGREKYKTIRPVVKYHPKVTRWRSGISYAEHEQARTKAPVRLVLKSSQFIRMPLPPSLAEQILDDRDWKKENKWAVPFMVNYKKVLAVFKKKVNCTVVRWDNYAD